MVRIFGLTMILLGAVGIGASLVDWRTIGSVETDGEAGSTTTTRQGTDSPAEDDGRQATELAEKPDDGASAKSASATQASGTAAKNAPPEGEASAIFVTERRDPANVKVFEQESRIGDEGPTLWADISAASEVVSEGSGQANFLVTLSEPADHSVVIIFSTVDLSASDDEDYRSQRGTVTFQPGVVSAEITTPLVDDDIKEEDEQFAIVLNGAPGIVSFKNRRITATIRDND